MNTYGVKLAKVEREDGQYAGDWQNSDHWRCLLRKAGRTMTVHFHKGYGHNGAEPTVEEILGALVLDSQSIFCAGDFENWANDFGYDTDSRKAEKMYQQCVRQEAKLAALMGDDYEALMAEEV